MSFSINYSRLHRLGGYGYTGLHDKYAEDNAPSKDGIFKLNLETKKTELLISIKTVSEFEASTPSKKHHYITHLSLNPNGDRLAFLHRYRLDDGGEMTRLMTIAIDGSNLRCLAYGYLSHFDWKDNDSILIWGRSNQTVANLRENLFLKKILEQINDEYKTNSTKIIKQIKSNEFILVYSVPIKDETKIAENIIKSDGHPMVNPLNRDVMICDTYPKKNGFAFTSLDSV